MSKQTAVESLISELAKVNIISIEDEEYGKYRRILNKAKEMEREQMEHAYLSGSADNMNDEGDFKKYYNETYKGGEQ